MTNERKWKCSLLELFVIFWLRNISQNWSVSAILPRIILQTKNMLWSVSTRTHTRTQANAHTHTHTNEGERMESARLTKNTRQVYEALSSRTMAFATNNTRLWFRVWCGKVLMSRDVNTCIGYSVRSEFGASFGSGATLRRAKKGVSAQYIIKLERSPEMATEPCFLQMKC